MAMVSHIVKLQLPNIPLSKADKICIFRDINFFQIRQIFINTIFRQSQNVGVNYVTSDSASVEAYREVGGCLSMSHFFRKISYLPSIV